MIISHMTEITSPRHAATLVLIRAGADGPRVLMGQRGAGAAFMPSKYVFPGGAVDAADHSMAPGFRVHEADEERLRARADPAVTPAALALAALRETWEETGLALGAREPGAAAPAASAAGDWGGFLGSGLRPATTGIRFIFRAITPPARSRRFDARFFLADSGLIDGDPDDLSHADGELAHLRWLTLRDARSLDLPFITEVVLSEVEARLKAPGAPRPTPFFHHDEGRSHLDHL